MLRRARTWASAEISRLLHAEVLDARAELETSMQSRVSELADGMRGDAQRREQTIAASLDRVATALDTIAEQLAGQARDQRASLAAVEFVVREMALVYIRPTAASASNVVGGTIEPSMIDLALDGPSPTPRAQGDGTGDRDSDGHVVDLHVGCIVEVRSRFQNRWVDGFEVTEIVERDGTDHYRLARHADHMQLPAWFEACDLRPLDVVADIVIEPLDDLAPDAPTAARSTPGDLESRR